VRPLAWCPRPTDRPVSPGGALTPRLGRADEAGQQPAQAPLGDQAPLPPRAEPAAAEEAARKERKPERLTGRGLKLVAYRPLFSGPDVERVPELQFQRPGAEVEVSADDADRRGIVTGDPVVVTANGTALNLRARVNKRLLKGVARIPANYAAGLANRVEVRKP
jgi:anaerobic selenocysteine-containing dehydrogenase